MKALTRILPTGTNRLRQNQGCYGFTLIELMVVLVIIVIMSSIAVLSMQPALRDAKMRSACRMVASSLNYARSRAVATNNQIRVVFGQDQSVELQESEKDDSGNQQWDLVTTSAGGRYYLPESIEVSRVSKSDNVEDENWLEFSGMGQAEDARIEMTDDKDLKKYIDVDSITGRCRIRTYDEEQEYENSDSLQTNK